MDITEIFNDYCYDNYYKKSKCTYEYYEAMAEKADADYEDSIFEEMEEESG